jgi:hypothetical protein
MVQSYLITTKRAAIIALFRVANRYVGKLPPVPGVFLDYPARNPDVRQRVGRLDARSLGPSKSAATIVTGRRLDDSRARYGQGRPRQHEALTGKHTRIQMCKSSGKE